MEVRINKEIKDYHESLFFGLSTRQCFCSALALGAAVGIYFGLRRFVGSEVVSWLCIVCSAPLAIAGFFTYNGMTFEKFIIAWIKSEIIYSGVRPYRSENIIYTLHQEVVEDEKKKKKKTPVRSTLDSD